MQHLCAGPGREGDFHHLPRTCQTQVCPSRCVELTHAPPLVRAPVNSLSFQPCDRTPQAGHLLCSAGTDGIKTAGT